MSFAKKYYIQFTFYGITPVSSHHKRQRRQTPTLHAHTHDDILSVTYPSYPWRSIEKTGNHKNRSAAKTTKIIIPKISFVTGDRTKEWRQFLARILHKYSITYTHTCSKISCRDNASKCWYMYISIWISFPLSRSRAVRPLRPHIRYNTAALLRQCQSSSVWDFLVSCVRILPCVLSGFSQ